MQEINENIFNGIIKDFYQGKAQIDLVYACFKLFILGSSLEKPQSLLKNIFKNYYEVLFQVITYKEESSPNKNIFFEYALKLDNTEIFKIVCGCLGETTTQYLLAPYEEGKQAIYFILEQKKIDFISLATEYLDGDFVYDNLRKIQNSVQSNERLSEEEIKDVKQALLDEITEQERTESFFQSLKSSVSNANNKKFLWNCNTDRILALFHVYFCNPNNELSLSMNNLEIFLDILLIKTFELYDGDRVLLEIVSGLLNLSEESFIPAQKKYEYILNFAYRSSITVLEPIIFYSIQKLMNAKGLSNANNAETAYEQLKKYDAAKFSEIIKKEIVRLRKLISDGFSHLKHKLVFFTYILNHENTINELEILKNEHPSLYSSIYYIKAMHRVGDKTYWPKIIYILRKSDLLKYKYAEEYIEDLLLDLSKKGCLEAQIIKHNIDLQDKNSVNRNLQALDHLEKLKNKEIKLLTTFTNDNTLDHPYFESLELLAEKHSKGMSYPQKINDQVFNSIILPKNLVIGADYLYLGIKLGARSCLAKYLNLVDFYSTRTTHLVPSDICMKLASAIFYNIHPIVKDYSLPNYIIKIIFTNTNWQPEYRELLKDIFLTPAITKCMNKNQLRIILDFLLFAFPFQILSFIIKHDIVTEIDKYSLAAVLIPKLERLQRKNGVVVSETDFQILFKRAAYSISSFSQKTIAFIMQHYFQTILESNLLYILLNNKHSQLNILWKSTYREQLPLEILNKLLKENYQLLYKELLAEIIFERPEYLYHADTDKIPYKNIIEMFSNLKMYQPKPVKVICVLLSVQKYLKKLTLESISTLLAHLLQSNDKNSFEECKKNVAMFLIEESFENSQKAINVFAIFFKLIFEFNREYTFKIMLKHAKNDMKFALFLTEKNAAAEKHKTLLQYAVSHLPSNYGKELVSLPLVNNALKLDLFSSHKKSIFKIVKNYINELDVELKKREKKEFTLFFIDTKNTLAKKIVLTNYLPLVKATSNLGELKKLIHQLIENIQVKTNHYQYSYKEDPIFYQLKDALALIDNPHLSVDNNQIVIKKMI